MLNALNSKDELLPFDEFLSNISESQALQAKFINTLSFLEYIGARKILKSQPAESVSLEILDHASEETRHARVLKKAAVQLSEGTIEGYSAEEMFCRESAKNYFHGLDHHIENQLGHPNPYLNYLYATLMIEERALSVYPKMGEHFKNSLVSRAIRGILAEEDRHLSDVLRSLKEIDPHHKARAEEFRLAEDRLFQVFAQALRDESDSFPLISPSC